MTRLSVGLVASAVATALVACATAVTQSDDTSVLDGGSDATTSDGSACPQYDLTKDPQHCGSCTKACNAGEVCSQGQCKAQCDAPTVKCSGDAGVVCINVKTDPAHCGGCNSACGTADAGAMPPGPNNPDSGIFVDGGYDGGAGWSVGAPACDAGSCAIACPSGMTQCADGICYDTQNFHDHCGDCNTACAQDTEWCTAGKCCPPGQMNCGGTCTDVVNNAANCGGCGITCSGQTPYCDHGACVKGCVPTGQRAAFNTVAANTTTGCWTGAPCGYDAYSWTTTHGLSFKNVGESFTCGGTTACVGNVGIDTYESSGNCQGTYDVYCDSTLVGSLSTAGKACQGSAMANGCSISFTPRNCTTIKLSVTAGSVGGCCGGSAPDTMITGVSAW